MPTNRKQVQRSRYDGARRAMTHMRWKLRQKLPPTPDMESAPTRLELKKAHLEDGVCLLCGADLTYRADPLKVHLKVRGQNELVRPDAEREPPQTEKRAICPDCTAREDVRPFLTL